MTYTYTPKVDRIDPTQGAYNGFSLADRFAAGAWAKRNGLPQRPDRPCAVCGQDEGLLYWHQEDYRTPVDAFSVCAWCHWALHSRLKPRQTALWSAWQAQLRQGRRPPPCPFGTRWQTFGARYLRTAPREWDWIATGERPPVRALPANLDGINHRRVPWPFRIMEGDHHLPGQFNSIETTGSLQVFRGFVPPLPF